MLSNLILGDCVAGMQKLLDDKVQVDCIITDPPYGVDFKNEFYDDRKSSVFSQNKQWLKLMHGLLKEGSHLYVFVPTLHLGQWITDICSSGFEFKNVLITRCKSSNYTKNNYKFDAQIVVYASKGKAKPFNEVDIQKTSEAWLNDKRNTNKKPYTYCYSSIFEDFSTALASLEHPNQKSADFLQKLVQISTDKGQIVLDPFMGSGSTGVACKKTGRDFIGIEQDKKYFELASKKLF